jgi:hypothetical protein
VEAQDAGTTAPRIQEENTLPTLLGQLSMPDPQIVGTHLCQCALKLALPGIEESNPNANLQAYWFVDFNYYTRIDVHQKSSLPNTLLFTDPLLVQASNTFTPGFGHIVDVVIAEEQAFIDPADAGQPVLSPGVKPGFKMAIHRYYLTPFVPGAGPCGRANQCDNFTDATYCILCN